MSRATIRWISGAVLRAVSNDEFSLREAVRVGPQALLGEVVRIAGDEIVVQVYEDTTGLKPGGEVIGSGLPLAIRLGPGLLGNIFDGLLRPLALTGSAFVAPGMRGGAPDMFMFTPRIERGSVLRPGAIIGDVQGGTRTQLLMAPPDVAGGHSARCRARAIHRRSHRRRGGQSLPHRGSCLPRVRDRDLCGPQSQRR